MATPKVQWQVTEMFSDDECDATFYLTLIQSLRHEGNRLEGWDVRHSGRQGERQEVFRSFLEHDPGRHRRPCSSVPS